MKKYVPIVTDDPQDNVEAALNLVFVKNEEVYVRGYGPAPDFHDATLSDVTRDILQYFCRISRVTSLSVASWKSGAGP